jgi:hypothetical protein
VAAKSPPRRTLAARIAAIERFRGPGDPRLPALRDKLKAVAAYETVAEAERQLSRAREAAALHPPLTAEEDAAIAAAAQRDADAAPPLTGAQEETLALLLHPGDGAA